ncbi:hypothetical protein [Mailhella massiliensis]|uniref:hypothetical protein n=1 Tax=Mailhella massiliensis TaxID=1903261 RepID=UPI00097D36DF|nr:hypothetical protein [Mailhella massiliensis]
MTRKFLPLMMALFLLASVVVLGEGFASSFPSFGASIDAGIAYADDDGDDWDDDDDDDDDRDDDDDDDDDDRRRGRRRY